MGKLAKSLKNIKNGVNKKTATKGVMPKASASTPKKASYSKKK